MNIISCPTNGQHVNESQAYEPEIDLSMFPPSQKRELESGDFTWLPVCHFERLLGLSRQAVKYLISTGELISYEHAQNPRTKLGYGRRAFVAVRTYPCRNCRPDYYEVNWNR